MKQFLQAMDDLPQVAKIILALPGLDILWAIYRIIHGIDENNIPNIILGAVWIIAGTSITWILDLIFLLCGKKILEF